MAAAIRLVFFKFSFSAIFPPTLLNFYYYSLQILCNFTHQSNMISLVQVIDVSSSKAHSTFSNPASLNLSLE